MKDDVHLFNWQIEIDEIGITAIGRDLMLLEKPIIKSFFSYPFKVDATTAIITLSGKIEGLINLQPHICESPSLIILRPGQILQTKYISEDFRALFVIMSNQFINNLHIQTKSPILYHINDNPSISLSDRELMSISFFFTMLRETAKNTDNPYRLETVKYLTKAFFYGAGYNFHKVPEYKEKSKHEILINSFLALIKESYKHERGVGFYADKLCLTPKYLSTIIKTNTGQSANDWIDKSVILEAKALLKSTNMTVQQISDELNFPSQSFFGKYFKRITGMSPSDYKKM